MAFSLDDVQRKIKDSSLKIDQIRRGIPTKTLGQKDVPLILRSLVEMRGCMDDCNAILMMMFSNISLGDNEESVRKYTSKIRQLSKLAATSFDDLMKSLSTIAVLEVSALKYNEGVFQWLPALYSLMEFGHRRSYWTYALNPESPSDRPDYSLYYRVDFSGLKMIEDLGKIKPTYNTKEPYKPVKRVEDVINPVSSDGYSRYADSTGYTKFLDKFVSKKFNDDTFCYTKDMTLWIRPQVTIFRGKSVVNCKVYKSAYPMLSPLITNELYSYYGGSPLQVAISLAEQLGVFCKDTNKLARFNKLNGNPALWGKI